MKKVLLLLILFSNAVIGQSFTLISKSPTAVSNSVALNSDITLNFSASTESSTIIADNIIITGKNTGIIAGSFSGGGTTAVVFNPTTDFKAGEVITVTLTTSVQNASNATLSNPQTYIFTTKSSLTSFEPSFTTSDIYSSADNIRSVFSADLDGDGDMDIISGSENDDKIAWHENDGNADPSFASTTIATSANGVYSIYVTDIDSDGDMDIVSASINDDTIAWYENDGNVTPSFTARDITTSAIGATNVSAADMDNDGDMDIISVSHHDNKISWYENDGAANPDFIKHDINEAVNGFLYSIFAADMDGDGDMDMVTASANNDRIDWYENDGAPNPNFTITNVATSADGARCIFVADMDNDGDMDIISASKSDNTIAWYENDGAANPDFTAINIYTSALIAFSVYAADMDNDGDMDIISGSTGDAKIIWHENDGEANPGFTTADINSYIDEHANTIFVADVDSDGDMDIISGSGDDDSIAWHENSPDNVVSTCEGVSGNELINPSFEIPAQTQIGNNIQQWPINGWNGGGSAPNIVKSDGVSSTGGPINAQEGIQYLDITNGSADFYQEFEFQCNTQVFFSGYFSVRENQSSSGRIDILRVNSDNTTDVVASSNQLNMPPTANIWYLTSGSTYLTKGEYRFQISMGDFTNFDSACFSFDNANIDTGSYDPLCESSSSITLTGTPMDSFGSWTGSGIVDNGDGTASFNPSGLGGTIVPVTYTYFNTSGFSCSESTNITVNQVITPIFTQVEPICSGDVLDPLSLTSDNGITGTWSPAIDNTATETYTFTPDASQTCAVSQTMTITVNPITPTFTQVDPICNGDVLDPLSLTSDNGITGTWLPAIDNSVTTLYTFTPDAGECSTDLAQMTITVNPLIIPTFTQVDPICNGDVLDPLSLTSDNGITGTWLPVIDNTVTTLYTFTPDAGECSTDLAQMTITVNPLITPTFTQVNPICSGDVLDPLSLTSDNGITGTWLPVIDNTVTTLYTFTPDAGECSTDLAQMTITVNPLITPTFIQVDPICSGDVLDPLSLTSDNGITGTWLPAIDNTVTTLYTFTPDAGECSTDLAQITITVNPLITPTFNQVDPICSGDVLDPLSLTSDNGITGTWLPAIDNTVTTLYTFTPDAGECSTDLAQMTITVNPLITPTFTQVDPICSGDSLPNLPSTSSNGITGTWSPAMNNTATTNYTFTPDAGQCAVTSSIDIMVNPIITPFFNAVNPIRSGDPLSNLPSTSNNGITGTWSPAMSNTATTNYTFTPDIGQCAVTSNIEIVVSNINNAFSPNGDGVNDVFIVPILFNYLDFEIEIFNRWGTKVYYYNNNGSTSPSWWDGYATVGLLQGNSKPLTVGTYYYIIHLNNKVKEKITGWIYLNR
jgi:gliding motility-associated-like protein